VQHQTVLIEFAGAAWCRWLQAAADGALDHAVLPGGREALDIAAGRGEVVADRALAAEADKPVWGVYRGRVAAAGRCCPGRRL
jgi:hypothetical protein